MAGVEELRIPFSLRGMNGQIEVSFTSNTDPASVGYSLLTDGLPVDFARGFPVCRAKVTFPADGYAAVFGWTQLIRPAGTPASGFEMDPIAIYRDVSTPFCWYGTRPDLFDAPSYESRPGHRRVLLGLHHHRREHQPHRTRRAGAGELGCSSAHPEDQLSGLGLRQRISRYLNARQVVTR
jgi:hypothetical protein